MKRIICVLLALIMAMILSGCNLLFLATTIIDIVESEEVNESSTEPKLYDFTADRGMGDSVSLKGEVMVYFIMVDDDESAWMDDELSDFKTNQEKQLKELEAQADRYDVDLELRTNYVQCKITGTIDSDNFSFCVDKALAKTGYVFDFAAIDDIKDDFDTDEAVVVFAFNKSGRSFAITRRNDWMNRFEYVILYGNDSDYAINHELMHVFRAHDFYYVERFRQAAESYFGESIMLSSDEEVDDLTAYLVGWADKPSDKAQAFLDATANVTQQEVNEAYDNDMLTGEGTRYYDNAVYTGEMVDGTPHGKGKMVWDDGYSYDGEWNYGEFCGHGVFVQSDGAVFEGEWEHDLMNGPGTAKYANGDVYVGEFANDEFNGKGKYTFAQGDVYEGEFLDSLFHGKGKYTYKDGSYYDGEWKNDDFDGYGTRVWSNGDTYVGDWSKGEMHGQGTYTYADGEVLKGTFYKGNYYRW